MSDLLEGFVRKQFSVEAVRVTPINIKDVAELCHGKIMHDGDKENQFSRDYIKVRVVLPLNDEQTKARIGDWVVRQGRTFKVYKDAAFRKTFEYPDGSSVLSDHQKFQKEREAQKAQAKAPEEPKQDEKPKGITLDELNSKPNEG